jgi:hypothetical protein
MDAACRLCMRGRGVPPVHASGQGPARWTAPPLAARPQARPATAGEAPAADARGCARRRLRGARCLLLARTRGRCCRCAQAAPTPSGPYDADKRAGRAGRRGGQAAGSPCVPHSRGPGVVRARIKAMYALCAGWGSSRPGFSGCPLLPKLWSAGRRGRTCPSRRGGEGMLACVRRFHTVGRGLEGCRAGASGPKCCRLRTQEGDGQARAAPWERGCRWHHSAGRPTRRPSEPPAFPRNLGPINLHARA